MNASRIAIACLLVVLGGPDRIFAQASRQSAAGERTSVDLTIYNQNLSLIREERMMQFAKGLSRLTLSDIPSTIGATSVHFLSVAEPTAVRVLEQNYQYDLVHLCRLPDLRIQEKDHERHVLLLWKESK